MNHAERELTDFILLAIGPVLVGLWRLIESETVGGPLRLRNSQPGRLTWQLIVNRFVVRMNNDLCFRLALLQSSHAASVVQVCMGARDRLEREAMTIDRCAD